MSALSQVSVVVCVCSIACSIVSIIIPIGRMRKIISMVLGVFLLCSMILPLLGLFTSFDSNINIDEKNYIDEYQSDSSYDDLVLDKTADNLVLAANNLLLSEKIEVDNIRVGIKKDENNSIYISSIYIYISKENENKTEDIKRIIGTNMSKEPVIIIDEK